MALPSASTAPAHRTTAQAASSTLALAAPCPGRAGVAPCCGSVDRAATRGLRPHHVDRPRLRLRRQRKSAAGNLSKDAVAISADT